MVPIDRNRIPELARQYAIDDLEVVPTSDVQSDLSNSDLFVTSFVTSQISSSELVRITNRQSSSGPTRCATNFCISTVSDHQKWQTTSVIGIKLAAEAQFDANLAHASSRRDDEDQ